MISAGSLPPLPTRQKAITVQARGKLRIQHDTPVVQLKPDMAIVRTTAVALNPIDAKMLDYSGTAGVIAGYDFAGTVVALGHEALAAGRLGVGDRVAGMVNGLNKAQPDVGAFAQYVGATADLLLRVPDHMSFEEAASLGMGVTTAVLALFSELQVPVTIEQLGAAKAPDKAKPVDAAGAFVLVAGGSTATGTRAIQLLKLAGLRPIATCSPTNSDLVRRFGAEAVFDYRSASAAADIRAYTGNELAYALDCISTAENTELCYGALGRAGGRYCALEPFREAVTRRRALTVKPSWLLVLTVYGHELVLDGEYARAPMPEHRRIGVRAYRAVQGLLDRGLIQAHPIKVMPGGWDGVIEGIDLMRRQTVSGYKLVYRLD